jgi:DNA-binding MarR family transcriptional regulator
MAKNTSQENAGFGFLIRDVSKLIRRRFEKKATKLGLTQAQWSVISHLLCHEGINQATLAEMMDIEPITLVGLLDRLEYAGWVERRPDPTDRRARLLYLTKQAHPIVAKMEAIKAQVRKEAFAGVPPQEERQIIQTLQRIRSNLTARGELFGN